MPPTINCFQENSCIHSFWASLIPVNKVFMFWINVLVVLEGVILGGFSLRFKSIMKILIV